MKTIALEEHYRHPGIKEAVERQNPAFLKEFAGGGKLAERFRKLEDLGEARLQDSDREREPQPCQCGTVASASGEIERSNASVVEFREATHKTGMDESLFF